MMISTKGRYGLRLMLDLATEGSKRPVPVKEIAKRQNISEKYLEQIISPLSKAGLVKSIRGAQGGYVLTRPATEITAGDILRAAEGTIAPVECCESGCDRSDGCVTFGLYKKIQDAVDSVVDSVTLADMLADVGISL
ncbi:MAG: Rrf2 family transcriptional regulator [Oscillospiraceae bacterium]|nr:Rrf2 family transcriptional regulator [Oscillospiraceae bacterium]